MLLLQVINSSNGTMTRSLRDVELFYKVQLDAEPWLVEPNLVAMPWTPSASVTLPKKLRVGIIKDDGVVRPTGPMARALAMAEKKLKSSPLVELVPYEPMDHATGISLAVSCRCRIFSSLVIRSCSSVAARGLFY